MLAQTENTPDARQKSVLPSVSLPKGGGAIRGMGEKFAANPVTGTGSFTVPIPTSPGRSGFEPKLALSYDSGAGNGVFGFGWQLSLPAITRKTDKGLPCYNDTDVFLLSGAEDLVPVLNTDGSRFTDTTSAPGYTIHRFRPRIEGLFARIERWTNDADPADVRWRSISKDNITTWYGNSTSSRIANPQRPAQIFSWLISESYDDKGNAIRYAYVEEDARNVRVNAAHERNRKECRSTNRYLKRIQYGNATPRKAGEDLAPRADWLFEVIFDYDEGHYQQAQDMVAVAYPQLARGTAPDWTARPDPFSTYRAGFEVRTYRRCHRVLMFHHFAGKPALVRSIAFNYADFHYTDDASVKVMDELTYQGSTRIASFIQAVTQSGYLPVGAEYRKRSLPPLEFTYSKAIPQSTRRYPDADTLANLPAGVDGTHYQWVDLDGEGLSGILIEQEGAWYYQPARGGGSFGPLQPVVARPSLSAPGSSQFMDLAGDGLLDLVLLQEPNPGFFERTPDRQWAPFRPFTSHPTLPIDDPNIRLVDLTGDGRPDILVTEDDVFTWYPSQGEDGFGSAQTVDQSADEERGPRLIFADGTQSIYLSDMSGDGLQDLVRLRNREVCYWPNLGYGKFGAKVTMDHAPHFEPDDLFDQRRIRLGDIDGSGTTDIIYLGSNGIRLYFNQSGNRWSDAYPLDLLPPATSPISVTVTDLLGNGTACLVWSSPLPADARRPLCYVDLMGGQKPHLLVEMDNNLGVITTVEYASSTKCYLEDKRNGTPWVTRLSFPVHVVERVIARDEVGRNRFVTRYKYHHGYFDGEEREFRGFGMVEQWDAESYGDLIHRTPAANEVDSSHVPAVHTKTWFHTGTFLDERGIFRHFITEYYPDETAWLLEDTRLPDTPLSPNEAREACRALKGSILRQEIYADDGVSNRPYRVSERNYTIELLQHRGTNRHAVFYTHPRETIDYHYERALYDTPQGNMPDPRITHNLVLEVDAYGNVLQSVAIGYGRRYPDVDLSTDDQWKQMQTLATYTGNTVTGGIDDTEVYRTPLPCETRTCQLYLCGTAQGRYTFVEMQTAVNAEDVVPYGDLDAVTAPAGKPALRLIEHERTLYLADDLSGLLEFGTMGKLALPGESYKLAFTSTLLEDTFQCKRADGSREALLPVDWADVLCQEGGFLAGDDYRGTLFPQEDPAGQWWVPSGQTFFSEIAKVPSPPDRPTPLPQDPVYARDHFYLPRGMRDPFGKLTRLTYDAHDLLLEQSEDALENTVTAINDYRVLQPKQVTDANGNATEVAFDVLGLVVATAVKGGGDSLPASLETDPSPTQLDEFWEEPLGILATDWLATATTRIVYDVERFRRCGEPPVAAVLARERHVNDGVPLTIQMTISHSDGFGREIQKKLHAEKGTVPERDAAGHIKVDAEGQPVMSAYDVEPRWVGSGWVVFNNKGKPVRKYEPFFSDTHQFDDEVKIGVTPILCYDPLDRVVATLHPNSTYEKVVFDPWRQQTWDVNDTVMVANPRLLAQEPHVAGHFTRLLGDSAYASWHDRRIDGQSGADERQAAHQTEAHKATPTVAYSDTLGRTFLTIADNGTEGRYATRVTLDIEGNQRQVTDALGRTVMRYDYDMLGTRLYQASMDAGERWMLNDVAGNPLLAWDSRGHIFSTKYDALRRPMRRFVTGTDAQRSDRDTYGKDVLYEQIEYGETHGDRRVARDNNLLTRVWRQYDGAGKVENHAYDFKGNLLNSSRQLLKAYKKAPNWSESPNLDDPCWTSRTIYDALNRPIQMVAPHNAQVVGPHADVIRPGYNAAGLLETVDLWQRYTGNLTQLLDPATADQHMVTDIDYDAKGQRELIAFGNQVQTEYTYDRKTFRLTNLKTIRLQPPAGEAPVVQSLTYTYDPTGNITHVQDDAQQTVIFDNVVVEPHAAYLYDAIYRLIEATGREHLGQTNDVLHPPEQTDFDDAFRTGKPLPSDEKAMGRYTEQYAYDEVGNFKTMSHFTGSGQWVRQYEYETDPGQPVAKSNRLTKTHPPGPNERNRTDYAYDTHGNMIVMPHLEVMRWNFRDQLQATARQKVNNGTPETTYYVYDASGQRARKVTEWYAPAGQATLYKKSESIYLGIFEIHRTYDNGNTQPKTEYESLHVLDDKQRIAIVETPTIDNGVAVLPLAPLTRYQHTNHLGTACLELSPTAEVITYEEYHPYGSTAFQAVNANIRAAAKRYRYTGKERDEESGFYYHGARYYAPWLGRWLSCDPEGIKDGNNLYAYVGNNPKTYLDPTGLSMEPAEIAETAGKQKLIEKYSGVDSVADLTPTEKKINAHGVDAHLLVGQGKKVVSVIGDVKHSNEPSANGGSKVFAGKESSGIISSFENAQKNNYGQLVTNIRRARSTGQVDPATAYHAIEGAKAGEVIHEVVPSGYNTDVSKPITSRYQASVTHGDQFPDAVAHRSSLQIKAALSPTRSRPINVERIGNNIIRAIGQKTSQAVTVSKSIGNAAISTVKQGAKSMVPGSEIYDHAKMVGGGSVALGARVMASSAVHSTKMAIGYVSSTPAAAFASTAIASGVAGGVVGHYVSSYVEGATGSKAAGVASGVLSGAATGAAVGAVIGSIVPGLGTAAGATIGAVAGAIGGLIGSYW